MSQASHDRRPRRIDHRVKPSRANPLAPVRFALSLSLLNPIHPPMKKILTALLALSATSFAFAADPVPDKTKCDDKCDKC